MAPDAKMPTRYRIIPASDPIPKTFNANIYTEHPFC